MVPNILCPWPENTNPARGARAATHSQPAGQGCIPARDECYCCRHWCWTCEVQRDPGKRPSFLLKTAVEYTLYSGLISLLNFQSLCKFHHIWFQSRRLYGLEQILFEHRSCLLGQRRTQPAGPELLLPARSCVATVNEPEGKEPYYFASSVVIFIKKTFNFQGNLLLFSPSKPRFI